VSDADVILLVTDVFGEPLADERVMSRLAVSSRPVVVVVNKLDLASEDGSLDMPVVSTTTAAADLLQGGMDNHYIDVARDDELSTEGLFDTEEGLLTSSGSSSSGRRRDAVVPQSMSTLRSLWKQRLPLAEVVGVSALRGEGVRSLLDTVLQHLSPGPKYFPSEVLTNRDERFFAAEIVREALLALFKVRECMLA